MIMANESKFKLSLPALEIDRRLQDLINLVKTVNGVKPDESGNVEIPAGVDVSGAKVGQTIVVKSVDENGKPTEWEAVDKPEQVQGNWNQNDPSAPDYVKNRPFYTSDPEETVLIEETTNEWMGEPLVIEPIDIVEGETYTVVFDGVEYKCIAYIATGPNSPSLGDGAIGEAGNDGSNGEPFFITTFNGTTLIFTSESGEHTISVRSNVCEIHTIDKKYLPETVVQYNMPWSPVPVWNLHDVLDIPYWTNGNYSEVFECTVEQWIKLINLVHDATDSRCILFSSGRMISANNTNGNVNVFVYEVNAGHVNIFKSTIIFNENEETVTATYTVEQFLFS